MSNIKNDKEDDSLIKIIVTVFAVIAILALAFLYYYFATKSNSFGGIKLAEVENFSSIASISAPVVVSNLTKVISFTIPEELPQTIQSGSCWVSSIAAPYREDAFRCKIESSIYDPCFAMAPEGFVYCPMNPLKEESFLIEFTESLPESEIPSKKKNNWAWFVELKDKTYCAPFSGTRIFIGNYVAYYSCNSDVDGKIVVLMGDLIPGDIWKANKAVVAQDGDNMTIQSLEEVEIGTIWQ